jgi:hypothetical protein
MIPIPSALENKEAAFANVSEDLGRYEFTLGGNWEYDHGYFDRCLDEARMVWIRVPFRVTSGSFDGDSASSDAVIQLDRPFVLKHIYNEGLDLEADAMMYKALVDQFQTPVDKDARVEEKWIAEAKSLLKEVEASVLH